MTDRDPTWPDRYHSISSLKTGKTSAEIDSFETMITVVDVDASDDAMDRWCDDVCRECECVCLTAPIGGRDAKRS